MPPPAWLLGFPQQQQQRTQELLFRAGRNAVLRDLWLNPDLRPDSCQGGGFVLNSFHGPSGWEAFPHELLT